MYDLFKKELTDLMNDVQNEIGDERTKQKQISLCFRGTLLKLDHKTPKKVY